MLPYCRSPKYYVHYVGNAINEKSNDWLRLTMRGRTRYFKNSFLLWFICGAAFVIPNSDSCSFLFGSGISRRTVSCFVFTSCYMIERSLSLATIIKFNVTSKLNTSRWRWLVVISYSIDVVCQFFAFHHFSLHLKMSVVSEVYNHAKLYMYNLFNTVCSLFNFPLMFEAFKRSAIEMASACSPELRAND